MKNVRPPIVTVLGHVDHGKTTLLDTIRKTTVAAREAGGITQGIGASQIETPEGNITFVDTPGHAAFSGMRRRGAKVADIVVLVVSADDGLMPQTKEALSYIKENKIPFIVAFTKVDLPSANVERAAGQLEQEEVYFEGRGGGTPSVEVSAKEGRGIDELIETIILLAGVSEITADAEAPLKAFVIETNKDKKGVLVSVVVVDGTLKVGGEVTAAEKKFGAKVKGLFDERGKPVSEAKPGQPAVILGFTSIPEVGAEVTGGHAETGEVASSTENKKVGKGQVGLVIKTKTAGSLEAVASLLPKDAVVLRTGVGEVTESDIFYAKSSGALVLAFETKAPRAVEKLADTEDVDIESFKIIYELSEFVEKKLEDMKVSILGKAQILEEFPFDKTRVAGCKVLEGRIAKSDKLVLMRGERELGNTKISSMKRGKNEITEARAGEECGLILSPLLLFEKGDILVATRATGGSLKS